jgi:hypothetical protein
MSSVVHSGASSKCAEHVARAPQLSSAKRVNTIPPEAAIQKGITRLLMQLGDIRPARKRLALQFLVAPAKLLATGGSDVLSTIRE